MPNKIPRVIVVTQDEANIQAGFEAIFGWIRALLYGWIPALLRYIISLWRWYLPFVPVGVAVVFVLSGLGADLSTQTPPEPVWQTAAGYGLTVFILGCGVGVVFRTVLGLYRAIQSRFGG